MSLDLPNTVLEGVATSSDTNGTLSTIAYSSVAIGAPARPPASPSPTTPCPIGWKCTSIGNPAIVGSQSLNNGTWTVQGGGADIWGTTDQFHSVWQTLAADGSMSAHILSQSNTDGWAKAGVMLRQSTDAGSPYYAVLVTPGHGIVVQYRTSQGASAGQKVIIAGTVPTYLKVTRTGNTYSTYTSSDGTTWTLLAGSSMTLNMSGSILEGLAVTSHNTGTLSTVTFDTVSTT